MTQRKITIVPREGLLVLDPRTGQPLPPGEKQPQGTRVPLTTYWHKRLRAKDVEEVKAPAETKSTKKAPKADQEK